MAVVDIVLVISHGSSRAVLSRLERIQHICVCALKKNEIVTVVEGKTLCDVGAVIKQVAMIENVIGIYPVYAEKFE